MAELIGYFMAAGILAWTVLKSYTVPGDYCVLVVGTVLGAAYLILCHVGVDYPGNLVFKAASAFLGSLGASTLIYRLSPFHPLFGHPGPLLWRISSIPLALSSFKGHRHLVLDRFHRRYGKLVRIGPNALSINSTGASEPIYGAANHMAKSDSYKLPGRISGVALFFEQTREDHATRKQIWTQGFTSAAIDKFFLPLERRTWQLTECIEERASKDCIVDMAECLCHWSYDFMGEMVFGGSNALELMKNGDPRGLVMGGKKATIVLDSFGQTPWLMDIIWKLPGSASMHYLRGVAAQMMRTRVQASNVQIRDLASYLMDGHPRTGQHISLSDLELDAIVAIQGGSDNTSTNMALAIYYMLADPPTYKKLQETLDRAFPDPLGPLDKHKLASIPFLDAVLWEALRLGSPYFLPRVVGPNGAMIDGDFVPGGTTVALAAYSQQVSAENFFPDPLVFRPERWLPGGLGHGSITNRSAIFSFSLGPHVCIAKSFAMQEMRHCLSRLVMTFDMTFPEGFDVPGFYKGLRNMRTTLFDLPLLVKAVRKDGRHTPADAM